MKWSSVVLGASAGAGLALVLLRLPVPWIRATTPSAPVHLPLGSGVPQLAPVPSVDPSERDQPEGKVRGGKTSEASSGPEVVASLGAVAIGEAPEEPEAHPEDLPVPSQEPDPTRLHPELFLGALSRETILYEGPSTKSKILGFARTGALLRRANAPAGYDGCKEGFYLVEPAGYICVGRTATLDLDHPVLKVASTLPDRSRPLPYVYGRSRYPTPPLYTKIPSADEQKQVESDLSSHLRAGTGEPWKELSAAPPPSLLLGGARIPRPFGYPVLQNEAITGRALTNSAFSFLDLFESDGRRYGLTTDLSLLPLDRLSVVTGSDFGGVILEGEEQLPVAFTRSEKQSVYRSTTDGVSMEWVRKAAYREGFRLSGRTVRVAGSTYFETKEGEFLKEDARLVRIEGPREFPKWVGESTSWIDVSILNQTLVAYRGTRPMFATLVSTGRDGTKDPATTHSTVQGVYRVHTKHVTATMSGDSADDEFDLRDVPYVQYFHEGYALHAAFWHDEFGAPRSHGCINLSPRDARYLFSWTEPHVPMRWHSALSLRGTKIYIHP